MKKKNKQYIILFLGCMLLLTGCSRIYTYVEEKMWENSGVEEEMSYVQFKQMQSADALNDDGTYHSAALEEFDKREEEQNRGTIHISFAQNEFLQFTYYSDAERSLPLSITNCRLNPGDSIFVSTPEIVNPNSSLYQFSEFRIRELDEKGNVKQQLAVVKDLPGLLYHIPEDFTGTEISVIPLGEYRQRTIMLSAVQQHPDGRKTSLENGKWEVDGKQYGNVSVSVNPMGSYHVTYDYSPYRDNWYFMKSDPEFYWENSNEAAITFLSTPSDDEIVRYEVILHPYGKITITNGVSYQNVVDSFLDSAATIFMNRSVIEAQNIIDLFQINGMTVANNFSDTEFTASSIKAGDEVLIRIPAELKLISETIDLPESLESEDMREYRFAVPDKENMDFNLTVGKRNSDTNGVFHETKPEHGTMNVYDASGIRYREGSELPSENERIKVEIIPEKDYCIYGRGVRSNVYQSEMKYADYVMNLEKIITDHPIKPGIFVTLDTTDDIGECAFWTNNELLTGTVMLREGQNLQFDYILDPEAGFEVVLTQQEREQFVTSWSPYAASRQIDVTEELQGKTLRCRDLVTIEKGVRTDYAANTY